MKRYLGAQCLILGSSCIAVSRYVCVVDILQRLSKKNGNYLGKVRTNLKRTEATVFTNDQARSTLIHNKSAFRLRACHSDAVFEIEKCKAAACSHHLSLHIVVQTSRTTSVAFCPFSLYRAHVVFWDHSSMRKSMSQSKKPRQLRL